MYRQIVLGVSSLLYMLCLYHGATLDEEPHHLQHHHAHFAPHGYISNSTLAGLDEGCKFYTKYETTSIVNFPMCVGQNPQDLKNGMSIINLIQSRGYLPTCRVLHLMLWMQSEVSINGKSKLTNRRDIFVDIGANIGSCSNHIASLGYPVISAEPVKEHVNTIMGTIESNPSFHIDLHHIGISSESKVMNVSFGHGARNWGASIFEEDTTANAQATLDLKTVDQLVGPKRVSLMKIDCEGCEWSALMGAKRTLRKTPMIKIELVQPKYTDGNTTATPEEVVKYLYEHGFELYKDHWLENYLYFGKQGNDVLDIDRMFGNTKLKTNVDKNFLEDCARKILHDPIDVEKFNGHAFQKSFTDIIAIDRKLSDKLKVRFMGANPSIITVDDAATSSSTDSGVARSDAAGDSLSTGFKFDKD